MKKLLFIIALAVMVSACEKGEVITPEEKETKDSVPTVNEENGKDSGCFSDF